MFRSWIIAIVELIAVSNCLTCVESSQGDSCSVTGQGCSEYPKLVRLDGVKVGHVQSVHLSVDRKHQLITRSLRPLLFEIPDFLSGEECEHIIKLAQEKGLFDSTTLDDPDDEEVPPLTDNEKQANCYNLFGSDENGDERISVEEFTMFIKHTFGMPLSDADCSALFHKIKFDNDEDGLINMKECQEGDHGLFDAHMYDLEKNHPQHRSRVSKQTWLTVNGSTDPVISQLQERVILLTRLPRVFIENSEELQVVYYGKHGHYHAHYDSDIGQSDPSFPCCREGITDGRCHLCRFITVLYYLNDVPRGGETAFPVADQEYFNETEHDAKGLSNLSTHCYDSNILVRPKRGTAVMWYNHVINNVTGLMGPIDVRSLHGGCDVLEGHKWIANNWIHAPFTWTGIS